MPGLLKHSRIIPSSLKITHLVLLLEKVALTTFQLYYFVSALRCDVCRSYKCAPRVVHSGGHDFLYDKVRHGHRHAQTAKITPTIDWSVCESTDINSHQIAPINCARADANPSNYEFRVTRGGVRRIRSRIMTCRKRVDLSVALRLAVQQANPMWLGERNNFNPHPQLEHIRKQQEVNS